MHLIGKTRKFSGKTYKAVDAEKLKSVANYKANQWRNNGYAVRIIKTKTQEHGTEYYIYIKKK